MLGKLYNVIDTIKFRVFFRWRFESERSKACKLLNNPSVRTFVLLFYIVCFAPPTNLDWVIILNKGFNFCDLYTLHDVISNVLFSNHELKCAPAAVSLWPHPLQCPVVHRHHSSRCREMHPAGAEIW